MAQVSVIIPVHDCELYVATAVESVLQQNYSDVEVIVVDDGSTDGTLEALAPYRRRIRVLRQEHRGVASARNKGVAAARGAFIAFLDADDWWLPSRLPAQFAALELFPGAGLAFSDFCVTDAEAVPLLSCGIRWKYGLVRDPAVMPWERIFAAGRIVDWTDPSGGPQRATAYCNNVAEWLFQGNFINTSSVLVRRQALLQGGGFDESLSTEEDYDLWLRVAQKWPVVLVDVPLVAFRRRKGQLTAPERNGQVIRNVATVVDRAAGRMAKTADANVVKNRLSKVHQDVGIICLRTGQNREARSHLRQSLNESPPHALTLILFLMSFFPAGVFASLERVLRALRHRRAQGIS